MLFVLVVAGLVLCSSAVLALFLVRLEKPSARAPSTLQALVFERAYQTHRLLEADVVHEGDMRKVA
jgi:hypothetical protein